MKQLLILSFLVIIVAFFLSRCDYTFSGCDGNCSNGYGVERWSDGGYQNGNWKNGKMVGYGKQHFGYNSKFAGDTYIGGFDTNGYEGYGVYYGKRQNFIDIGYWKNGKPDGYGIARFGEYSLSPNRSYEGWWKNGVFDGYGILHTGTKGSNSNIKYVGYWLNGLMDGNGIYYWSDGSRYVGHFSNDLFDGDAAFILSDGLTCKSTWHGGRNPDFMNFIAKDDIATKGKDSVLIDYFSRDSTNLEYFKNLPIM
jgi:hypothetical protein